MLEKYEVALSGTIQDIDRLVYAIESMHNMRDGYYCAYGLKDELKGTWIRPTEKSVNEIQKTLDKIVESDN